MKNNIRTFLFSCLAAAVPALMWADGATPSDNLTFLTKSSTSTIFSFNYPTVNNANKTIVCSAALIAWTPSDRQETDSIESIHIYSHATIGQDSGRPSTGDSQEMTVLKLLPKREYKDVISGAQADYVGRCIIIAPDYEGYGATKDHPHPYLAERLTAQQVLDALKYGMQLYKKHADDKSAENPVPPVKKNDWRTFGLGYSQGAAVTLALQRLVEESNQADELHYYGSVCGDGPYDLIATMNYYFNDDGKSYDVETDHRKGFCTYPVVVPLIFNGLCVTDAEVSEYKITDYLSEQLIDTGVLDWIDSKKYHTNEMAKMWYDQLQNGLDAHGRHYTPEQMGEMFTSPKKDKVAGRMLRMLSAATYAYLNDPDKMAHVPTVATNAQEALHIALAKNNVAAGWMPKHRIQFYHSRGDMVVPYGNYLAFQEAHKDGLNTLYRINDTYASTDHMDAATIFFLTLSGSNSFADDFNWISEGYKPSAVNNVSAALKKHNADRWYMLDGRPLSGKPSVPGIYILNNQKVVVER